MIIILAFIILILSIIIVNKHLENLELKFNNKKINLKLDDEKKSAIVEREESERIKKELRFFKENFFELIKKVDKKSVKVNNEFNKIKVIVGESDEKVLSHIVKILMSLGFQVDIAQTGSGLIDKMLFFENYDLIITCDNYKDNKTSVDILEKANDIFGKEKISVIILSDSTSQSSKLTKSGFKGTIEKMITLKKAEKFLSNILLD